MTERERQNEIRRLQKLIAAKGWNVSPAKLLDMSEGIARKVDERTPNLSATDRTWIIERTRERICGLVSPNGGNFPRHLLTDKNSHWDVEILLAYQQLLQTRTLEQTHAIMTATQEVFRELIGGLEEYARRLEEAARG